MIFLANEDSRTIFHWRTARGSDLFSPLLRDKKRHLVTSVPLSRKVSFGQLLICPPLGNAPTLRHEPLGTPKGTTNNYVAYSKSHQQFELLI